MVRCRPITPTQSLATSSPPPGPPSMAVIGSSGKRPTSSRGTQGGSARISGNLSSGPTASCQRPHSHLHPAREAGRRRVVERVVSGRGVAVDADQPARRTGGDDQADLAGPRAQLEHRAGREPGSSSRAQWDWCRVQLLGSEDPVVVGDREPAERQRSAPRARLITRPPARCPGTDLCVLSHHGLRADFPQPQRATTGRAGPCVMPCSSTTTAAPRTRIGPSGQIRTRASRHQAALSPSLTQRPIRSWAESASRCRAAAAPNSTSPRRSGCSATHAPHMSRAATCSCTASASTCSSK